MEQIDTYKKSLETELTELEKELTAIGIHDPQNTKDWVAIPEAQGTSEADPNEAADRVEEWDERRGTVAVLERRYNNIVRALGKIAEENYGICEIGNEQIEIERLDTNPAARTCKAHMEQENTLSIY